MKKLIPTIGMALLGASLLGTSTYAWFSANTSATAEGLQIKAQASSSLLISATSGGAYGAKATIAPSNGMKAIVDPVTKGYVGSGSASTTSQDFKKLNDASKAKVLSDGTISASDATYVASTDDFAKSAVYLMYSGSDATPTVDAKVTISNASPQDNIWKSIHVALYTAGTATSVADFQVTALGTATAVKNLGAITSGTEQAYDVYVWIEGTDTNCYNSNALAGDTYGISLDFALNVGA